VLGVWDYKFLRAEHSCLTVVDISDYVVFIVPDLYINTDTLANREYMNSGFTEDEDRDRNSRLDGSSYYDQPLSVNIEECELN